MQGRHRLAALALALSVVLTACGSSDQPEVTDPVAAAAEANQADISLTGELATTQMLDVRTGGLTSLDQVVTGDRAVLLWYWAPD